MHTVEWQLLPAEEVEAWWWEAEPEVSDLVGLVEVEVVEWITMEWEVEWVKDVVECTWEEVDSEVVVAVQVEEECHSIHLRGK